MMKSAMSHRLNIVALAQKVMNKFFSRHTQIYVNILSDNHIIIKHLFACPHKYNTYGILYIYLYIVIRNHSLLCSILLKYYS